MDNSIPPNAVVVYGTKQKKQRSFKAQALLAQRKKQLQEIAQPLPLPLVEKIREVLSIDYSTEKYIRDAGKVKLLTREQEVRLATRMRSINPRIYARAFNNLVEANLRLVINIAAKYLGYGLPFLDLVNEGNIGLMKGAERFDPRKGGKMSTYSSWWIKQSIKRALANTSKTIRIPVHLVDQISRLKRTILVLEEEFGRPPTDEEVAEETGMTASKVAHLLSASIRPTSLDAPINDDPDSGFHEVLADPNISTPYEELEGKNTKSMMQEMLCILSEREAQVLTYRFGLDGDDEKTLQEVGDMYGVTRERIRQIEERALAKLRREFDKRKLSC